MLRLGVNIDHVATLRQARGTHYPAILDAARACEAAGAHGITVHLREDRRHIQDRDVCLLRENLRVPLNLEMAHAPEIVKIAVAVKPAEVCLVPEKREELTTEGGLDVVAHEKELAPTVRELTASGIEVSLFVDPDLDQIEAARRVGASTVELHTGTFCNDVLPDAPWEDSDVAVRELDRLVHGAGRAHALGLRVNAGHGLNLHNLDGALETPHLHTLNIGHSIVSRALFVGLADAVREMLEKMGAYAGGRHE